MRTLTPKNDEDFFAMPNEGDDLMRALNAALPGKSDIAGEIGYLNGIIYIPEDENHNP